MVVAGEAVGAVSSEESGDGGALDEGALLCLEDGELAGEGLGLELLGLGDFLGDNFLSDLNT